MIEHIKEALLALPKAIPNHNGDEIAILRCPFCGDSHKSDHGHLHIAYKPNGSLLLDCKKCFSNGPVTPEVMHKLGVYDIDIDEYLKKQGLKSDKSKLILFGEEKKIDLIFPNDTDSINGKEKINYISARTGIDFSKVKTREQYKIILNIDNFLTENGFNPKVRQDRYNDLVEYGIGFISHDNKSISIRDMSKTSGTDRFTILHFNEEQRSQYLYMPPCNVDVLTDNPTIVMSEAAFNTICIKKYFFTDDSYNIIYGATGSVKAYTRTLNKLLYHSCFFGGTIICYVDNDETFDLDFYKKMFEMYLPSFNIKLVVNQNGKDFGEAPEDGKLYDFKVYKL